MPINPNIALGVRPIEQPNMLGQMAQVMAIRQANQEYENEGGLRNALVGGATEDPSSLLQYGKSGRATYESILKGKKEQLESSQKRIDMMGGLAGFVRERPTPENFASSLDQAVNYGLMTPAQKQAVITQYGGSPESIKAYADQTFQQAITAKDQLSNATQVRGQNLSHSASMASVGATMRGQDITDKRIREQLHPIETGAGPGTYQQFGPNAGIINPMTQAPWQPRGAPVATPNIQSDGLSSGTYGMGGGPNTLPATVGATAPVATSPNMMLQGTQPLAAAPTGYTQATPKGPTSIINVNTQTTASEEAQKEFMKGSRTTFDQLKQAPTVLENIEKAKALVPTAKGFMGTGGETLLEAAKFMNNRLGTSIDTAGIKSAEELNSRLFMGIMDNLKKMDAQPSQQQQAAMKQALGNIGTDPSAMNAVLDVFGDIVRGKVDIHNAEVMGAEARGVKFPYNPVIKLKEKNPASTGDIATDAGVAKVIKSNAEYNALPSGTTFTAPDGSTRRKP